MRLQSKRLALADCILTIDNCSYCPDNGGMLPFHTLGTGTTPAPFGEVIARKENGSPESLKNRASRIGPARPSQGLRR
jgi:hypothetical protein